MVVIDTVESKKGSLFLVRIFFSCSETRKCEILFIKMRFQLGKSNAVQNECSWIGINDISNMKMNTRIKGGSMGGER